MGVLNKIVSYIYFCTTEFKMNSCPVYNNLFLVEPKPSPRLKVGTTNDINVLMNFMSSYDSLLDLTPNISA